MEEEFREKMIADTSLIENNKEETEKYEKKIEELENEIEKLKEDKKENKRVIEEYNTLQSSIKQFENQYNLLQSQYTELQSSNESLSSKLSDYETIKNKIISLSEEKDKLIKSHANAIHSLENKKSTEIGELENQVKLKTEENEQLNTKLKITENSLQQSEEKLKTLLKKGGNYNNELPSNNNDRSLDSLATGNGNGNGTGGNDGRQILTLPNQQYVYNEQLYAIQEEDVKRFRKKIEELNTLLHEAESSNQLHLLQITALKDDIRELERSRSRESANLEYLKNIVVKYMETHDLNVIFLS